MRRLPYAIALFCASVHAQTSDPNLEAAANRAQAVREKKIKKVFITKENVLDKCVADHGGVVLEPFNFGREITIAYRIQIGDDALAQRFLKYISKASQCTAFDDEEIERGLLPALPHLRNTGEIGTLTALVGDICASKADSSAQCFARGVLSLMQVMHVR